ncbi:hypothetical protein ABTZ44_12130 [Microbacterium oxydans]|uniref:hypothetical protein n=1 Tax=Microbacterium TaxID=33882 RepID=UPI00187D1DF1|nr:hypothetical protein [Microbacterium sp. R1]MBE7956376.1 hypothetical protein [Microbacterium sp. R1]
MSGLAITVVSLLRMLLPGLRDSLPDSLVGRSFGSSIELALALTGGLAVIVVSGFALVAERGPGPRGAVWPLRTAGLLTAAFVALTIPGGMIPTAGYTFAVAVILGIVALVALTTIRCPWVGIPIAALVIGGLVFSSVALEATGLPLQVLTGLGALLPEAALAFAHVTAAAGLLVWVIGDERTSSSTFAGFVHRHRIPITLIAAACALPYAIARASWLTPWPLFGGSTETFVEEPITRATGLMLGLGMLVGGLLTLGLILPWGARFPRFLAGVGGRAIPPALAIVPASVVSVLFTAAGGEFVFMGTGDLGQTVYVMFMLPFWLWGPLLGLAAWGYAMHRAGSGSETEIVLHTSPHLATPTLRS